MKEYKKRRLAVIDANDWIEAPDKVPELTRTRFAHLANQVKGRVPHLGKFHLATVFPGQAYDLVMGHYTHGQVKVVTVQFVAVFLHDEKKWKMFPETSYFQLSKCPF